MCLHKLKETKTTSGSPAEISLQSPEFLGVISKDSLCTTPTPSTQKPSKDPKCHPHEGKVGCAGAAERGDVNHHESEENRGEKVTKTQQALVLIAAVLYSFQTIGYTQSYGVFQAHYASEAAVTDNIIGNKEHKSQAAIAAIGSLGNGGIVALFSILLYPWLPSLGRWVRLVCFFGACLMSLGLGLAAASRNFAHLLCTQGIIFGLGSGIIQYTLAPVLPEYFNKRAGLAQGIVIAAAGLGGGCYSPLVRALLQGIGTRKTLGVLAAIHLVVNTIASMMARGPRKFQKRKKGIVGFAAFKEPIVVLLMAVNFISALIVMVPMCFGPEFSKSLGYNSKTAALLLALTSLVGVPARLLLGCLADKLGHQNTLFAGIAVYAASAWAIWLPTAQKGNKALWIIFLILYGLVNGVAQTLIPSVQKSIFGNEKYYSYAGVFASGRGVGLLFGVLIAGELIKKADEAWEFSEAIIYTASLASIGAVCLFLVRWLQARKAGWKWVQ